MTDVLLKIQLSELLEIKVLQVFASSKTNYAGVKSCGGSVTFSSHF